MIDIMEILSILILAFNVAILSRSISKLLNNIKIVKDVLDIFFSRLEIIENALNLAKVTSKPPVFDRQKFFDELPSHPMTSKEASKAIEAAVVRNYNTLPIEVTVVDMFNLGVKIGRIKETEDGKIHIVRSETES